VTFDFSILYQSIVLVTNNAEKTTRLRMKRYKNKRLHHSLFFRYDK